MTRFCSRTRVLRKNGPMLWEVVNQTANFLKAPYIISCNTFILLRKRKPVSDLCASNRRRVCVCATSKPESELLPEKKHEQTNTRPPKCHWGPMGDHDHFKFLFKLKTITCPNFEERMSQCISLSWSLPGQLDVASDELCSLLPSYLAVESSIWIR